MDECLCARCRYGIRYEMPCGYYCEKKRNFGEETRCSEFEERSA